MFYEQNSIAWITMDFQLAKKLLNFDWWMVGDESVMYFSGVNEKIIFQLFHIHTPASFM